MGIVQRIFRSAQNTSKWLSQGVVQKWMLFVLTIGFSLNVLNVFAQETNFDNYKVNVAENYEESDTSGTALTGDPERNVDKTTEFQTLGALHTTLKTVCGLETCFEIEDEEALSQLSPLTRRGLVGVASDNMIALMTNPPTVNVVGHLAQDWVPGYDITNSVYAAENGYQFLVDINISPLWETVRTISYIGFVLILIAAGFMIIFRHKIGGQMAVTIFNALPNVVIGLIMATFSFALVGIFIDIGAILVKVVASVLAPGGGDLIAVTNPFSLFGIFIGNNTGVIGKALADSVGSFDIANMVTLGVGGLVGIIVGVIAGAVTGLVLLFIMLFVVCLIGYASIKVYITLLQAYLGIILDTVLSPLVWAFGSLPGNQNLTTDWIRRVIKNILTFPAVFFFVNLGIYVLSSNIGIGFPAGLSGGDISANGTGDSLVGLAIKFFLPIILMFLAAESPKFLEDFLPSTGGKGAGDAIAGVGKSMSKFFGGG
jgi:hypothetical protein